MNLIISNIAQNRALYFSKKFDPQRRCYRNASANNVAKLSYAPSLAQTTKAQDEAYFEEFIERPGKVSLDEYSCVKKFHPYFVTVANNYCESNYGGLLSPTTLAEITLRTDKYFKKNYRNYRIISVGTSPSPLCEQLSLLGHDVVFLPVSGLRDYKKEKHKIENTPELQAVMEYLETKNIKDGKMNIILDYKCNGTTLNAITDFVKEYFSLDEGKVLQMPLDELLRKAMPRSILFYPNTKAYDYLQDTAHSLIENISNVPHYYVLPENYKTGPFDFFLSEGGSKQELYGMFENYSNGLARAFSLCTMDEINRLKNIR